jgi:hypothetical protein
MREAAKEAEGKKTQKLSSKIASFVAFICAYSCKATRQPVGTAVLLLEFYGGVAQAGRPRLYPDQPAGPRTIGIATPTPTRGSKPEMDGNQILEVMRRNAAFKRLPIVVLTAMKGGRETAARPRRSHQTGHCRAASVRLRIRLHH